MQKASTSSNRCHHSADVALYCPTSASFPSFSVTGTSCELSCLHCSGHYLHGMKDVRGCGLLAACTNARDNGAAGALISGGSGKDGVVPLPYEDIKLASAMQGFALNVHSGPVHTVPEPLITVDCISLDIPPSDYTVKTVYGIMDASRSAYFSSLETLLEAGARVVPHVCMGIDGKGVHGEPETLEILESYVDHIVLLSLKRTPGLYHTNRVPSAQNCEIIIKEARERFKCLGLGCMRDRAPAKERLWHYFDTIAWPSSIIKDELARSERTCTTYDICCAV